MHILVEGPADHPVVVATMVATKLRDSVTLAGGALVGGGGSRAAMPEVPRSPEGGRAYLPPSHLSNAILQPTAASDQRGKPKIK